MMWERAVVELGPAVVGVDRLRWSFRRRTRDGRWRETRIGIREEMRRRERVGPCWRRMGLGHRGPCW